MDHFMLKLGFLGLLPHVFILILLIKSFHLVPNLTFKSVALPLFDPKIGPKSEHPTTSFWPF